MGLTTTLDKESEAELEEPLWLAAFLAAGDEAGSDRGRAFGQLRRIAASRGERANPTTLLPAGSSWRIEDSGKSLPPEWKRPAFDDSAWRSASAPLGFGDPGLNEIAEGDPKIRAPTTYFRTSFEVESPAEIENLRLRLRRDDGAVVYLNGTEVRRDNLPGGEIAFSTYALEAVSQTNEGRFFETVLDRPARTQLLVPGKNTVAIEIHQVSADSSDLAFDFELIANVPHAERFRRSLSPDQVRLMLAKLDHLVPRGITRHLADEFTQSKAGE
jgi:hypothetical protein